MSAPKPQLRTLVRRLDVRPAEALALAALVCGALVAVGLTWWLHRPEFVAAEPPRTDVDDQATEGLGGLDVSSRDVIVHVAGAVRNPGVFTLPGGSRVGEAVEAAGGSTRRAQLDGLNLARVLTDGEQVLVPDKRSQTAPAAPGTSAVAGAAPAAKLSLNQASAADFETLPGIGPVLAERIVAHRDSVGGFTEVGELRDVTGIGEKTFQALAELVAL